MIIKNQPLSYDYHGELPFTVPFNQIKNHDIHIYLDVDTHVGKKTCGQNCQHCWFVNYERAAKKSFGLEEGRRIYKSLINQGYQVFPRYADTFALNGKFMETFGPANNREFRFGDEKSQTKTMEKGDAWTSGRPLLADNYIQLLQTAERNGYGTISITFHATVNENGELNDHSSYPIKGVFPGTECLEVIRRIKAYNLANARNGLDTFRINIGITIGNHNNSLQSLKRYCQLFNSVGVSALRFNSFTDHGGKHPDLQPNQTQIAETFAHLKWIHENISCEYQIGISEDFGTSGVQVLGLPDHFGWCRAGRQLFAIIPCEPRPLNRGVSSREVAVGHIVGCVNIFEPYLGDLVQATNIETGARTYNLKFDADSVDAFTQARVNGEYENGCFAGEVLQQAFGDFPKISTDLPIAELK